MCVQLGLTAEHAAPGETTRPRRHLMAVMRYAARHLRPEMVTHWMNPPCRYHIRYHRGMTDVLVRDVPPDDLELIRSAAADRGMSLQRYLRETVHAQATYLRRQDALARAAARLRGTAEVPTAERRAVLDSIAEAETERASHLGDRPAS